jgi:hypothetical protein
MDIRDPQTESSSAPLAVQYARQGRVERLQKLLEADPKAVAVTGRKDDWTRRGSSSAKIHNRC